MALASPIGQLNIANCSGGGVSVTATTITWFPVGTVAGTGCINTGLGTSVAFLGGTLGAGVAGNIKNLTAGGGTVDQFMMFTGVSTPTVMDFMLTGLPAATATNGTNCASTTLGQSCVTFAGSPFLLTNLGANTAVSLTALGTVSDANGLSNWSGAYTTQLTQTVTSIQTTILAGGSVSSTYSAQFGVTIAGIPEPVTALLISSGLIALGLLKRRSRT